MRGALSMSRPVGLHQITAMDVAPTQLAKLASDVGCDRISVFTFVPQSVLPGQQAPLEFPLIRQDMRKTMLGSLAAHSVRVMSVEFFPITPETAVMDYAGALGLGRELGAVRAVTHIHDQDSTRA